MLSTTDRDLAAPSASTKRAVSRADAGAVAVLLLLTALALWNRFTFDEWLARFDLFTFFIPWYDLLGQRLSDFEVPGWNPSVFSGTAFAGDPASGWMYLPAMVAFAILPTLTAFKAMVAFQLLLAGVSTYAFGRVIGMGPGAALVAGAVYVFGPLLHWNTFCCLVFAQHVVWIPLALLGVELGLRRKPWAERIVPWFVAAFAISQMFAGWIGEGWLYAVFLVGGYAVYRALLAPPDALSPLRERLTALLATGLASFGLGFALGAAGILPRLAVNGETNIAGGRYSELGPQGILNRPWELDYLFLSILGNTYEVRRAALGGAALVLALLAPIVAGRRFAVPFFLFVAVVAFVLALDETILHQLFYLIPRYQELHEHDPWRTVSLAPFAVAMLSGAAVEALRSWRGRWWLVLLPLLLVAGTAFLLWWQVEEFVRWPSLIAAGIVTAVVAFAVSPPGVRWGRAAAGLVPAVVVAVAFVQPTGMEITGSWFKWPAAETWQRHWYPDPIVEQAIENEVTRSDVVGPGTFLQTQLDAGGPFRYVGYGGAVYPGDARRHPSYMSLRFEPFIQAILVNGRPMILGLYEIQGYNPLQLKRYVEFMAAVNGLEQNYHVTYLRHPGTGSPLLDLLNVRYAVVDASLPQNRDDVVALVRGGKEVFRTPYSIVYERPSTPHAWIVHDVREVARGEALPLLTGGGVDPRQTALVEGAAPPVAQPGAGAAESTLVTRYEPERITIAATAAASGLLVVSEVYEKGWRAYVDGEQVDILPTHHVLRGVPLPAGEHTVELRYEPPSLRWGLLLSGLATAAMLAAFGWRGWAFAARERAAG